MMIRLRKGAQRLVTVTGVSRHVLRHAIERRSQRLKASCAHSRCRKRSVWPTQQEL